MNFLKLISSSVQSSQSEQSQKVHEFDTLNDDSKVKRLFDENQKIKFSMRRFIKQSKAQIEPLTLEDDNEKQVSFSIEAEKGELNREIPKELKLESNILKPEEENPTVKHKTISNFNTAVVKKKLSERINHWKTGALLGFDEMLQTPQLKSVINEINRKKRHSYTKGADSKRPRIVELDSIFPKPTVKLSLDEMKSFKNNVLQLSPREDDLSPKEGSIVDDRELFIFNNVYDSFSDDELENIQSEYIIHPNSYFQRYSDLIICLSLFVTLFFTPICAAFDLSGRLIIAIDIIIDLIYTTDLILGFFKAFHDKEENLIFVQRKIIVNYLFTYFIFDLIAAFPFNSLITCKVIQTDDSTLWQMFRFLRLAKAMKISVVRPLKALKKIIPKKIKQYRRQTMGNISNLWKNFFRYLMAFIIIIHILTCFWIYLGRLDPEINWFKFVSDNSNNSDLYVSSFYFNMVTLYTVGYGDIHSLSLIERLYNILLLILALIIYSFIVSFVSKFAIESDPVKIKLTQNVEYLDNIAFKYHISLKLFAKIKRFLIYNTRANNNGKNNFLFELPSNLRNELICSMYRRIINNFVFFKKTRNQDFNARVLLALRPVKAYKNEKLIKQDDFIDEIILVRKGKLQITCEYKDFIIKLIDICKNEHFGDVLMLLNERSPVTIKVKSSTCELYLLRKFDLMNIFVDFEEIFKIIFNNSSFNMMQLKKIIKVKKNLIDDGLHLSNSYDFTKKSINENNSEGTYKNKVNEFNTIIMEEEDEEEDVTPTSKKVSSKMSGRPGTLVSCARLNKYLKEQKEFIRRSSIKNKTIKYNHFKEDSPDEFNDPSLTDIKPTNIFHTDSNDSERDCDSDEISVDAPIKSMQSLHLDNNINIDGRGRKNIQINTNNHINIIVNHSDDSNEKKQKKYVNISLNLKVENNFHIVRKITSSDNDNPIVTRKRSKSIAKLIEPGDIEQRLSRIKQSNNTTKQLVKINMGKKNNSFCINNGSITSQPNANNGCIVNNTVINVHKTVKRKGKRCATVISHHLEDSIKEKLRITSKKDMAHLKKKTRKIYTEIEKNFKVVSLHSGIGNIFNNLCEQLNKIDQRFLNRRLDSLYSKLEKIFY
jgi:hypothetical protein